MWAMVNLFWAAFLISLFALTGDVSWLYGVPVSLTAAIVLAVMD